MISFLFGSQEEPESQQDPGGARRSQDTYCSLFLPVSLWFPMVRWCGICVIKQNGAAYKNSWAQGWTARASKEANPPALAARPAARGVSSPFLQDILQRFLQEICTQGGNSWPDPNPSASWPPLGRLLPSPDAFCPSWHSLFGFQNCSENIPKRTTRIAPTIVRKYVFL